MRVPDFLTIRDFTSDELLHLLSLAREIKADPVRFSGALKGRTVATIFEKPSLRTRVSFDVGIHQLAWRFRPRRRPTNPDAATDSAGISASTAA